jgi:hypothetical protein
MIEAAILLHQDDDMLDIADCTRPRSGAMAAARAIAGGRALVPAKAAPAERSERRENETMSRHGGNR